MRPSMRSLPSFIGDEQYYLVSASGGRFKILKKTPSDSKWWIEGSPYVKVEQILGEAKVPGIDETITYVKAWKIVMQLAMPIAPSIDWYAIEEPWTLQHNTYSSAPEGNSVDVAKEVVQMIDRQ